MRWLVLVLLTTTVAFADEPECKPTGKPVLSVEQQATGGAKLRTATTKLYGSGGWRTVVRDRFGDRARETAGCLAKSDMDVIRDGIAGATWKVRQIKAQCPVSARVTVYTWNDRTLYRDRSCDGRELDEKSQRVLSTIDVLLHVHEDMDMGDGELDKACLDNPLAKGCH